MLKLSEHGTANEDQSFANINISWINFKSFPFSFSTYALGVKLAWLLCRACRIFLSSVLLYLRILFVCLFPFCIFLVHAYFPSLLFAIFCDSFPANWLKLIDWLIDRLKKYNTSIQSKLCSKKKKDTPKEIVFPLENTIDKIREVTKTHWKSLLYDWLQQQTDHSLIQIDDRNDFWRPVSW